MGLAAPLETGSTLEPTGVTLPLSTNITAASCRCIVTDLDGRLEDTNGRLKGG